MSGSIKVTKKPDPALLGMIQQLPPTGEPISPEFKDRFLETFEAVLDYVNPPLAPSIHNKAEH